MNANALEPPRFRNSPSICEHTNLPAFDSPKAIHAFFDRLPAISVDGQYQCKKCGGWHAHTHIREASGASSGTGTRRETLTIPDDVLARQAKLAWKYWLRELRQP